MTERQSIWGPLLLEFAFHNMLSTSLSTPTYWFLLDSLKLSIKKGPPHPWDNSFQTIKDTLNTP